MSWYEFSQNNSGGSFITNKKVCHRVYIEAADADEANSKAETLGIYFNGIESGEDCPCCGDRWYPAEGEGDKFPYSYTKELVFNTPEEYMQYLANTYGWNMKPEARLYYNDGRVLEICKENK